MKRKNIVVLIIIVFSAYFTSYIALTISGTYSERVHSTGKYENFAGFAIKDIKIWIPRFVKFDEYNNDNRLGVLYAPMVCLDRKYWHRNINIYTPEEEETLIENNVWFLRDKPQGL